MVRVAARGGIATVTPVALRLASEAALPARNFNETTRDRRFFSRLAVPLFIGRPVCRRRAEFRFPRLVWSAILA
jgi:hypothetical protein